MAANEPLDGERGVHVSTASAAAFEGQIGQVAYAASKGGVVGLTLPAARDLAQYGIRVCAIAPGPVRHADARRAARGGARVARALRAVPAAPRAARTSSPTSSWPSPRNPMLNGETIRLDGALRMAPR